MHELDNLLTKLGFRKKEAVKNDVQKVECLINFVLPDDYKYYLNTYYPYEGFINREYVSLYGFNDISSFNAGLDDNDKLSKTVLIGSNGASESIGLRFVGESNYCVVIGQYIYNLDDQIEIGTSFTDMIERLVKGVDWFQ